MISVFCVLILLGFLLRFANVWTGFMSIQRRVLYWLSVGLVCILVRTVFWLNFSVQVALISLIEDLQINVVNVIEDTLKMMKKSVKNVYTLVILVDIWNDVLLVRPLITEFVGAVAVVKLDMLNMESSVVSVRISVLNVKITLPIVLFVAT